MKRNKFTIFVALIGLCLLLITSIETKAWMYSWNLYPGSYYFHSDSSCRDSEPQYRYCNSSCAAIEHAYFSSNYKALYSYMSGCYHVEHMDWIECEILQ